MHPVVTACVLATWFSTAAVADIPHLEQEDWFNDYAHAHNIDLTTRDAIHGFLSEQEMVHGNQIVVLIVESLPGVSIEEYAQHIFYDWRIGQKGIRNGVLVVVAHKERNVRIVVSENLKGLLNDNLRKTIADDIRLGFSEDDFGISLLKAVNSIAELLAEPSPPKPGAMPRVGLDLAGMRLYLLAGGALLIAILALAQRRRRKPPVVPTHVKRLVSDAAPATPLQMLDLSKSSLAEFRDTMERASCENKMYVITWEGKVLFLAATPGTLGEALQEYLAKNG